MTDEHIVGFSIAVPRNVDAVVAGYSLNVVNFALHNGNNHAVSDDSVASLSEVDVLHDLILGRIDGAIVHIEHRIAHEFAAFHLRSEISAVMLGKFTTVLVVDLEVSIGGVNLFTHESHGIEDDLTTVVGHGRSDVHDSFLLEVVSRDGEDHVEANFTIMFLKRIRISFHGDLVSVGSHGFNVARFLVELETETEVEVAVHIVDNLDVINDSLTGWAFRIEHFLNLIQLVVASPGEGVIEIDVQHSADVEVQFKTNGNGVGQFSIFLSIEDVSACAFSFCCKHTLDSTCMVADTTETDVRDEVEHSSWVVAEEQVGQVEGQIHVSFHESGLNQLEVAVIGCTIDRGKQLIMLFTTQGTSSKSTINTDHLTNLVTDTDFAVKVFEDVTIVKHELTILGKRNETVIGKVSVVNGETTICKDVEIPLHRKILLLLSKE